MNCFNRMFCMLFLLCAAGSNILAMDRNSPESSEQKCLVCSSVLGDKPVQTYNSCGHIFHAQCVSQAAACPLCFCTGFIAPAVVERARCRAIEEDFSAIFPAISEPDYFSSYYAREIAQTRGCRPEELLPDGDLKTALALAENIFGGVNESFTIHVVNSFTGRTDGRVAANSNSFLQMHDGQVEFYGMARSGVIYANAKVIIPVTGNVQKKIHVEYGKGESWKETNAPQGTKPWAEAMFHLPSVSSSSTANNGSQVPLSETVSDENLRYAIDYVLAFFGVDHTTANIVRQYSILPDGTRKKSMNFVSSALSIHVQAIMPVADYPKIEIDVIIN